MHCRVINKALGSFKEHSRSARSTSLMFLKIPRMLIQLNNALGWVFYFFTKRIWSQHGNQPRGLDPSQFLICLRFNCFYFFYYTANWSRMERRILIGSLSGLNFAKRTVKINCSKIVLAHCFSNFF